MYVIEIVDVTAYINKVCSWFIFLNYQFAERNIVLLFLFIFSFYFYSDCKLIFSIKIHEYNRDQ